MARQASAERAWAAISRFYDNIKKGVKGKRVGFPKFQKDCRSVEYKTNSWVRFVLSKWIFIQG
jgi:putative transposase